MAIAHRFVLAGVREALERVLADGLEHPVAHARAVRVAVDERVLDERLEGGEDLLGRKPVARAGVPGELERRSAGEHAEPSQQDLGVGRQEPVAPVQRRAQRLVARRHRRRPCGEQAQRVLEAVGDRGGREHRHPGRGQLQRERHPLEAAADLADRACAVVVLGPPAIDAASPVDEQRRGIRVGQPGETLGGRQRQR